MTWQGNPRTSTAAWRRVRKQCLDRDGWSCAVIIDGARCGKPAIIAGHIVAWSLGGKDELSNLRAECDDHAKAQTQAEAQAARALVGRKRPQRQAHPGVIDPTEGERGPLRRL